MNARLTVSMFVVLTLFASFVTTPNAQAQFLPDEMLIESFEGAGGNITDWVSLSDPNYDWTPITTGNANYVSHTQSATGVTHGSNSLELEMRDGSNTWGFSLFADSADDTGLYDIFNTVAADESAWLIEMDLTLDASSWANVSPLSTPPFTGLWSLNMGMSVDAGGVGEFGQSSLSPQLFDQTGQYKLRVPMTSLVTDFTENADSYQILLGHANGVFQSGDGVDPVNPGEGMKIYLDNLRFVPATPTVSETLFSWEGSLEGWDDDGLNEAHAYTHVTTVSPGSDAATHGSDALSIDTTIQDPFFNPQDYDPNIPITQGKDFAFYWGTTYRLNADTDPDPNNEVIDPNVATQISTLVEKLNRATAIAFDLHYNDVLDSDVNPFAPSSPWSKLGVHVSDGTGAFFDEEGTNINPPAEGDPNGFTFEYVIATADMVHNCSDGQPSCGESLASLGATATNSLTIGIDTNAGGALLVEIDNFRLIYEVDLSADFDNDGDVDNDDLAIWEANYGLSAGADKSTGDANGDGAVDGRDFLRWQQSYGIDATSPLSESIDINVVVNSGAVPEPTSAVMLALGALLVGGHRGRRG